MKTYQEIRESCESEVATWRYANSRMFYLEPFAIERGQLGRGRWLKSKPESLLLVSQYGLDANGRIVIDREIDRVWRGISESIEFFYRYHVDYIEEFRFRTQADVGSGRPNLILSAKLYLEDGLPARYEVGETLKEKYKHSGGRLVEIDERRWYSADDVVNVRTMIAYDAEGELAMIKETTEGHPPYVVYYKMPKGVSVAGLAAEIETRLLAVIPNMIAKANIADEAYCIALAYDLEGTDIVPGFVGVGLEKERQEFLKKKNPKVFLWNPAEFSRYEDGSFVFDDQELQGLCDKLNAILSAKEQWGPAKKILNNVAAKLAKLNWQGILKTTPDFVVYATDLEMADLKKNMAISIPASKLAEFKKKGWL